MLRKNIPEWVKSIPKHKLEEALAEVAEMTQRASEDIPDPNSTRDGSMREAIAFRRGAFTALSDVLSVFEGKTIMASVKKKKVKESA